MASPLLYVALSFSSGILIASLRSPPPVVLAVLICLGLVFAWVTWSISEKSFLSFTAILFVFFISGAGLFTHRDALYHTNSLRDMRNRDYLDFEGRLSRSPSRGFERDLLYLRVDRIFRYGRIENVRGQLRVAFVPPSRPRQYPPLYRGDRVRISARPSQRADYANFQRQRKDYSLKAEGVHATAFTKSPLLIIKTASGHPLSPLRLLAQLRQRLQTRIEAHFWSPTRNRISVHGAVLEALLLGQRGRLETHVQRTLQNSGLYHLMAISGAHVAVICLVLFKSMRLLRIPKRGSYLLLVAFLAFYAHLVEGRPSVIRATLMTGMYLLGKFFWKEVNLLNTLALSALLLLLLNPYTLFTFGFQLTYAATLAILLFASRIMRRLPRLPFKAQELFAMTLSAQAGVLPLVAVGFNRITLSAFLLNFAALPLLFIIMSAGFLFLPLSLVCAPLAGGVSHFLVLGIDLLLALSRLSTGPLGFLSYRIPTPSLWTCGGYAVSGLLLLRRPRHKWQYYTTAACFLLFTGTLISYPFASSSSQLKITFIDVGQGDSILVEFPGRRKMLVDGGGSHYGSFDVGERIVSPFLWRKGIKRIDYLVSTHPHPDHLLGLQAVLRNFRVGEFWEAYSYPDDRNYADTLQILSPGVPIRKLYRGEILHLGEVRIEVLNPPESQAAAAADSNNASLVLRISDRNSAFLLTGDVEAAAEKEIREGGRILTAEILKAPHHGSASSSTWEFLRAVSPRVLVVTVGKNNRYNFPHQQVLERYASLGATVYRTDRDGAVEITATPHGCLIRTGRK